MRDSGTKGKDMETMGVRPFTQISHINEEEHQALKALLLRAEGLIRQQIAEHLCCGDQTVRKVLRAFAVEELRCLEQKSSRSYRDTSVFDTEGLLHLEALIHQSPRAFGLDTSQWTLKKLAVSAQLK